MADVDLNAARILPDEAGTLKAKIGENVRELTAQNTAERDNHYDEDPVVQTLQLAGLNRAQESLDSLNHKIEELTVTIKAATVASMKDSKNDGQSGDRDSEGTNNDLKNKEPQEEEADEKVSIRSKQEEDDKETGEAEAEEGDDEKKQNEGDLEFPSHCIPDVRVCDLEHFENRFGKDIYAIEILKTTDTLPQQEEEEEQRRQTPPEKSLHALNAGPIITGNEGNTSHLNQPDPTKGSIIHRVRINSRPVVELLCSFADSEEDRIAAPMTFMRPFAYLIHFQKSMKQKLDEIKKKLETKLTSLVEEDAVGRRTATPVSNAQLSADSFDQSPSDTTVEQQEGSTNGSSTKGNDLDKICNEEALKDIQCYVEFVETDLMPLYHQFDKPDLSKPQTVRYSDLWYLFKVGDLIHVPSTGSGRRLHGRGSLADGAVQRIYFSGERKKPCTCSICQDNKDSALTTTARGIDCYYLDYDGTRYGPVKKWMEWVSFKGEREVTELPFYPLRFVKDSAKLLEQLQKDGNSFVKHVTDRYSFYSGWTLMKGPLGEELKDAKGEIIKTPEHIESDVLVDFVEAFQWNPEWKPDVEWIDLGSESSDIWWRTNHVRVSVLLWNEQTRRGTPLSRKERWLQDSSIYSALSKSFVESQTHLLENGSKKPPSGEDLVLLPRRMFAYAVWDRKFVHIDSRYLNTASTQGKGNSAFEQLQIFDENKRIISSLVQSHFKKKQLEEEGIEVGTQDLIRGKGRGLIILLHGVPGVGKTATAEAIAQKWSKPLFPITCGDLGFTPEKVESSLKEIFRLAHLWDCVLLLDEADVFIAQREKSGADLQRNALVSVFLRMLEYYNGVLFLTTNRVGVLDEAVKSRVHLHLRYGHLTRSQTIEIFSHNIGRLEAIEQLKADEMDRLFIAKDEILKFAGDHFDKHAKGAGVGVWNGRQIRNAFVIASSIANHDGDENRRKNPKMQKQLNSSHFDLVDRATALYDAERALTLAGTDGELAHNRAERTDDFGGLRRSSTQMGNFSPRAAHPSAPYTSYQHPASAPPGDHTPYNPAMAPPPPHGNTYGNSHGAGGYGMPSNEERYGAPGNDFRHQDNNSHYANSVQQGRGPSPANVGGNGSQGPPWQPNGPWRQG